MIGSGSKCKQVAALARRSLSPSMSSRVFRLRPSALLRPRKQPRPFIRSRLLSNGIPVVEDEDEDVLDISTFGNYSLVLPEDPYREGVSHIIPAVVPHDIARPPYVVSSSEAEEAVPNGGEDLEMKRLGMRHAGLIAALALRKAGQMIKVRRSFLQDSSKANAESIFAQPGVTTKDINDVVHDAIIKHRAYPSPLLYKGFPMSCCTSVNNVLAHGIPDECVASGLFLGLC